jgi:hypothetical protein
MPQFRAIDIDPATLGGQTPYLTDDDDDNGAGVRAGGLCRTPDSRRQMISACTQALD